MKKFLLLVSAILFLSSPANAQYETECPGSSPPEITVQPFSGDMLENRGSAAFTLARKKSKRYGMKMPLRQGSLSEVIFKPLTTVEISTYPALNCYAIAKIDVKLRVDQKIELASELAEDSCAYAEFYNLEIELLRRDEMLISEKMRELEQLLKERYHNDFRFGPFENQNIEQLKRQTQEQVSLFVQAEVNEIEEEVFSRHRASDSPEYFDDILARCGDSPF